MGFLRGVRRAIKTVLPIAASIAVPALAPSLGITSALGTAALQGGVGAASGALSGGGLKGALLGGAGGGLGGYVGAGGLGSALSPTSAGAIGGALSGAGAGAASGGLKGALLGGALGGAGGYALSGGMPETFGTPSQLGAGGIGPATQGSGLVGDVTRAANTGGLGALTGSGTGGIGSRLNLGANLLSTVNNYMAQDEMEKQLLEAQQRSQDLLSPYMQGGAQSQAALSERLKQGFNPQDLASDPGYQFQLQQGQEAINRQLANVGSLDSGRALKAAAEYGQGLADKTFNDAYQRWLQQNQQLAGQSGQGLGAASGATQFAQNVGNVQANRTLAGSNLLTGSLASLMRGDIIGYRSDGTPIYRNEA